MLHHQIGHLGSKAGWQEGWLAGRLVGSKAAWQQGQGRLAAWPLSRKAAWTPRQQGQGVIKAKLAGRPSWQQGRTSSKAALAARPHWQQGRPYSKSCWAKAVMKNMKHNALKG